MVGNQILQSLLGASATAHSGFSPDQFLLQTLSPPAWRCSRCLGWPGRASSAGRGLITNLSSLMPSSRDLPYLLPAVLKISEEAQSKIDGGILKLLAVLLLLVFFYSFVLPFLVKIWFQIDNFHNFLAICIKIGKSNICPVQLDLDQEAGGFPCLPP